MKHTLKVLKVNVSNVNGSPNKNKRYIFIVIVNY